MRIALLPEKVVKAKAFQQATRERGEVIVSRLLPLLYPWHSDRYVLNALFVSISYPIN